MIMHFIGMECITFTPKNATLSIFGSMGTNNGNKKEYGFTSLAKYFNGRQSPRQLADDIARVLSNYATLIDCNAIDGFKNDAVTLQCIYKGINRISEK